MLKATFQTILIPVAILAGVFTSNAQTDSDFRFGIKAGANFSKLTNSNGKSKIGVLAGVFSEYQLSEKLAIRSEAFFSNQGIKGNNGTGKTKLNYLNAMPVIVKFYPIDRFSLEVGPYTGYLMSKKGGNLSRSQYRKIDYGASLGMGVKFSDTIEFGARYFLGLRDITKVTGKVKNRGIQAALSFYF